ncbi:MAG: hypothetical protein AAGF44_08965 [Pseudomonadota bacterium]
MTSEWVGYLCLFFGVMLLGSAGVMLVEQAALTGAVATETRPSSILDIVSEDLGRLTAFLK